MDITVQLGIFRRFHTSFQTCSWALSDQILDYSRWLSSPLYSNSYYSIVLKVCYFKLVPNSGFSKLAFTKPETNQNVAIFFLM